MTRINRNRLLKTDEETLRKIRNASLRLSDLQRINVPMGEVVRRMTNIEGIKEILEKDAKKKRGLYDN